MAEINMSWRPGVSKIAIFIGDAHALVEGGAETISGITPASLIAASISVYPVQVLLPIPVH